MQRRDNDKIDLQVKKALGNIKPAYREDLWQGIEAQLPARRNPLAMYWRSIAAAILLITAGTTGYYFLQTDENAGLIKSRQLTAEKSPAQKHNTQNNLTADLQNTQKNNGAYIVDGKNTLDKTIVHAGSSKFIAPKKTNKNRTQKTFGAGNHTNNFNSNIIPTRQNTIYTGSQKYLQGIEVFINKADNNIDITQAGRYKSVPVGQNPNKKRTDVQTSHNKIFTYAFWNNPAFTGRQGKLHLSFDDRISYLQGEVYSEAKNNFGAEYRLPGNRFAVGVYHQRMLRTFSLRTATGLTLSANVLTIGNGQLSAGAGITYLSSKLFKYNLKYSDQIDAKYGFVHTSRERDFTSEQNSFGADAGLWYSNSRLMAGISCKNLNQPRFGRLDDGERLKREWQAAAGYKFTAGKLNIMPWAEVKTSNARHQGSAMLLVSYKDIVTIGGGYMNVSQTTRRGDLTAQASVEIKKSLQLYATYGHNMQMQKIGLQQSIIQSGIRYTVR